MKLLPGGAPGRESQVDKWLAKNDLDSLQGYMRTAGVETLEACLSLDLAALEASTDSHTSAKLEEALGNLDLVLWLKNWTVLEYGPVLEALGYTSRLALCSMTIEEADQVAMEYPVVDKQGLFKFALQELQEEPSGWCAEKYHSQPPGWTVGGVLFYVLGVLLVVVVIVAVLLLIGTIVVVAVFNVLVGVVAAIFSVVITAVVGGIFAAIVSAFTGRRVNIPPPQPLRIRVPTFSQSLYEVLRDLCRNALGVFSRRGGGGRANLHSPRRRLDSRESPEPQTPFSLGLYERMRGSYLDVEQSSLEWNHEDEAQVGSSSVLTIKLVCKNGSPYLLKLSDSFGCRIASVASKMEIPHVVEPTSLEGQSQVEVAFTAKVAGHYRINLMASGKAIGSGEIVRNYLPGPVDSNKTVILDKTAVVVVTKGVYSAMKIIPKDSFGNKTKIVEEAVQIEIRKDSKDGEGIRHEPVVYKNDYDMYEILIKLDKEGHYVGSLEYEGVRIGPPHFTIICLSEDDMQVVEKNVKKKNLNVWYEALIVDKSKKVYCYISPRQLQVREYFMKLIPTRSFTCKVSPSTQITFHSEAGRFTLDDGFQEPLTLASPHREILAATFYKFVLKNIGGSEKFQDKQTFFYSKLREHHNRQSRGDKRVVINRADLLESARKATKGFSQSDWCKKFCIVFRGEEGLDWGGLSREFFELLCVHLFDASNQLFMRFNDNNQALVHPNYSSKRPPPIKLKHFFFAGKIVGKCLYESCMGNTLLVKARFTRSFLAQLIGLRINYKYFESDDPDLYTTKIQYILENDVTDLDLVFAEEEFAPHGGPPTVIPLLENGETQDVTEENKSHYLNALAQYRLTKRVSEEISHFMKGLNEIVPDSLLSMFDENELELLMCGMGTVSHEDLKEHAIVSGTSPWFQHVLSWFWIVISSFTQEEMAKLLQFVTGCSQLPPGGFKELNPRFTITSTPSRGRLPTAHTCFNQLCLPEYSSVEQFHTSLMIALNEGGEGFGLL